MPKTEKNVAEALLSSVEENDEDEFETSYSCKALIELFHPSKRADTIVPGHSIKQQQSLILEAVGSMQKNHAKRFFSGLTSILETIVSEEAYVPASAFEEEGDESEEKEIVPDEKSTECLHLMKFAAMCASAFLRSRVDQAKEKRLSVGVQLQVLTEVYDVAATLHNILLSLHTCGPESSDTQTAVLALCEAWWFANAANRDALIAQCLPLLVVKTLDGTDFKNAHMTKLFKLRDAFQVIDFTNPSSDSLRHLLLRIASNPLCLRVPEGRKFLASLFRDSDLLKDLHMSIRAQIPEAKSTVLKAYGQVYHTAWKSAVDTPAIRDGIEHHVLQDLMYSAIHVSSPGTVKSIHTVLQPIHVDKKAPEVAGLLYRSYSPILWRSLAAANPLVRKNAVVILEKVFPLHDPDQSHMKVAVSKATTALKKALQDKDPRVRVAGCEATAKICTMFWDALPASEIRMLLNHIVLELASDGSSSAVRAAALDATTTLLDTNQSHAVLRGLLPCLGNMIHDKAERVRLAACRMLIRIKRTPGIKFYHVVPVDHLTARLSEESRIHNNPRNTVAHEISSLLLNSYFPQGPNASANLQVQRTLSFLTTDPNAASVFYANLVDFLDAEAVSKFIAMLLTCLNAAVEKEQDLDVKGSQTGKKRRRRPGKDNKDTKQKNEALSASNLPLMASLAETIAVLLESFSSVSDESYKDYHQQILSRFLDSQVLNILTHFEHKGLDNGNSSDEKSSTRNFCFRICAAILRSVKTFSSGSVDGIVPYISSSLENIPKDSSYSFQLVSSKLSLLCAWGMIDDVAAAMAHSIESAFGQDRLSLLSPGFDLERSRRRSRGSLTRNQDNKHPHIPTIGAHVLRLVLDDVLKGSNPSTIEIRESLLQSTSATSALEVALGQGPVFAERLLVSDSAIGRGFKESEVEFILWSCEAYGRFALHREAIKKDENGFNKQVKTLLDWSTEKVVPALLGAQSGESELRDLDLSRISNVSDSLLMPESPSLESPPRQRANVGRTPEHMSRRSGTPFENSSENDPAVFLVSASARALLQSSCVVFAELLAVGGSCGNHVAEAGVEWLKMFQAASEEDDKKKRLQEDVVPSFIRLAIQLCKSSSDFRLLKELFMCSEHAIGNHSKHLSRGISSLLNGRSRQSSALTDGVICSFLDATDELIVSEQGSLHFEMVQNLHEVWDHPAGCVTTVLEGIVSIRSASLLLIRKLVSRIAICVDGATAQSTFYVKCLGFMMSKEELSSVCTSIIADLDLNRFEAGGEMHTMLGKVLEYAK